MKLKLCRFFVLVLLPLTLVSCQKNEHEMAKRNSDGLEKFKFRAPEKKTPTLEASKEIEQQKLCSANTPCPVSTESASQKVSEKSSTK